jgi:hypothetical protein
MEGRGRYHSLPDRRPNSVVFSVFSVPSVLKSWFGEVSRTAKLLN